MGLLIDFAILVSFVGSNDPTLPVLGLGTAISWGLILLVGVWLNLFGSKISRFRK